MARHFISREFYADALHIDCTDGNPKGAISLWIDAVASIKDGVGHKVIAE